jgi:hypothetical protein
MFAENRKKYAEPFAHLVAIICTCGLAYLLWSKIDFSMPEWTLYLNSKLARIIAALGLYLLFVIFAEWGTDGNTIGTIVNIDKDSSSEDKRTAAFFVLGQTAIMGYLVGLGI